MKMILSIGYRKFLLPDDKGVQTILRALSHAQPLDCRSSSELIILEEAANRSSEVAVTAVPRGARIVTEQEYVAIEQVDRAERESRRRRAARSLTSGQPALPAPDDLEGLIR